MHSEYYDRERLVSVKKEVKKVFFYRICGTGMGAAACLLKEAGYEVEGADARFYPPMSEYLQKMEIKCLKLNELNSDYMLQFDLIVVGNVVPKNSDDAKFIESLKIPFCSFPAAVGALVLKEQNVIGIAGTHGKTTTTYLFTQVFENLGEFPGYLIGGVLEPGRPSSRVGSGKYFFIESDEYDSAYFEKFSKFRSYFINTMILTSLEFDHADIFQNLNQIKREFKEVLPQLDRFFIYNQDYQGAKELLEECPPVNAEVIAYGQTSNYGPQIVNFGSTKTTFSLRVNGKEELFETNLIGVHNILNLSTVIFFAAAEGYSIDKIKKSIENLRMVKRRQEERGFYKDSLVIDDFAHHPTAVYLTIDAIKQKYPGKKVTVVFEPNSATARSNIFQEDFYNSLKRADNIYITKLERPTSVSGHESIDCEGMVANYIKEEKKSEYVETLDGLIKVFDENAGLSNVFLVLSNGTCLGLWESEFVSKLQR